MASMMQTDQQPPQQDNDLVFPGIDLSTFDLADFVHSDVYAPQQQSQSDDGQQDAQRQQQQQQQQQQANGQMRSQQQQEQQDMSSVRSTPAGMPTPPSAEEQQISQIHASLQQALQAQLQQRQQQQPQQSQQQSFGPSSASIKDNIQLATQLRLQQLQQLQQMQQQLIQQQMELLNGPFSQQQIQGLLTPAPSNELRPTVNQEFVSPMMLQNNGLFVHNPQDANLFNQMGQGGVSNQMPNPSFSAPAAFQFQQVGLPGDGFSPLTSPALGPQQYVHNGMPQSMQNHGGVPVSMPLNLSNLQIGNGHHQELSSALSAASSNSQQLAQLGYPPVPHSSPYVQPTISAPPSTTIRPTIPSSSSSSSRGKKSASSDRVSATMAGKKRAASPSDPAAARPSRARGNASRTKRVSSSIDITSSMHSNAHGTMSAPTFPAMGEPNNTPSPVDISMPPSMPLSDPQNFSLQIHTSGFAGPSSSRTSAPVTPASLMNLPAAARQPSGLTPILTQGTNAARNNRKTVSKSKSMTLTPLATSGSSSPLKSKADSRSAIISPALKPILPGGLSAEAVQHLSLKSNYQNILEGRASDLGITLGSDGHGGMEVRKTSHKAAEQKRRDSLKAGFDDLRLLLPPITIDPEESGEHIPGTAPPRGPARNVPPGGEDHPNRGVSKLALLRHSNDFIMKLAKRIERRDAALLQLHEEVVTLRSRLGEDTTSVIQLGELDAIEEEEEEEKRVRRAREREMDRKLREAEAAAGGEVCNNPQMASGASVASGDDEAMDQDEDAQ